MQSLSDSQLSHLNADLWYYATESYYPPWYCSNRYQVDGVLHEFSTIDGVVEDVT